MIDLGDLPPPLAAITHVEALDDETVVITVPRAHLRAAVLPVAASELLEAVSARANQSDQLLVELFAFDGRARLAHGLAELAPQSTDMTIRLTHTDPGEMVGLQRQQVSVYLAEFRERGLVSCEPHQPREIAVLDADRLERRGVPCLFLD